MTFKKIFTEAKFTSDTFEDLNMGDLWDDPKGEKGMMVVDFDRDDEEVSFELDDGSVKVYKMKDLKRLK